MALYAIGDIHLTFHSDKDMSVFGEVWRNHEEKFLKNYTEIITPDDTVVFTGDHTWGGHLSTCRPDLDWICELPGRKILLRGNHDIFWQIKKTRRLMEEYRDRLYFLQDNFWSYGEYALVGSKGYCYEPWDNNERALELAAERYRREEKRVRKSFEEGMMCGISSGTNVAAAPIPIPLIASVVTASVGHVPRTSLRTGFSLRRPLVTIESLLVFSIFPNFLS